MKKFKETIEQRLTARTRKCMEFCGDLRGKRMLNIGCYNGWLEKFAVENGCVEIIEIDTNEKTLVNAIIQITNKNAKFLKISALDLSQFEANYFDMVTMFDVVEHLPRNTEIDCLKEVKRVMKNDGMLLISTPNNSFFYNVLDPAWYFGHRHYSRIEIYASLNKSGFKCVEYSYGGGFYELFSLILLYFFKWVFRKEIPFKNWFEKKREEEHFNDRGFVTLFVRAIK